MTTRKNCVVYFVATVLAGAYSDGQENILTQDEQERAAVTIPAQEDRQRPEGELIPETVIPVEPGPRASTEDGMRPSFSDEPQRRRSYVHQRWYLGVDAYNTSTGVHITAVVPRSPAQRVGLEPGDTIVAIDGYQVGLVNGRAYYLSEELQRLADRRGQVRLLLHDWRNGRLVNVDVNLAPWHGRSPRRGR